MYEVTVTTEDLSKTYEIQAMSAADAEQDAIELFETEYGNKAGFHQFGVEVR